MQQAYSDRCIIGPLGVIIKGRHQNSLPLTTNFSQNVTEPSKGTSYSVGDLCLHFTKLTGSSAYTLHSNPIPPTDGTNGLLWLVSYISQTGHQCLPACFCHPSVGNVDVSPNRPYWWMNLRAMWPCLVLLVNYIWHVNQIAISWTVA